MKMKGNHGIDAEFAGPDRSSRSTHRSLLRAGRHPLRISAMALMSQPVAPAAARAAPRILHAG
jgi:hypothetical protein